MFSKAMKELRMNRNMTQVDLASELGVSKQSVSNWENENILPSIEILVRVAKRFSVSTDYLLGLDSRRYLEITGITEKELVHIQQLVDDLCGRD